MAGSFDSTLGSDPEHQDHPHRWLALRSYTLMPWFRSPERLGERRRVVKISDRLPGAFPLSASVAAWLLCRLTGCTVAAWVAPLAIGAFCLGLFVGAENTTRGRFRVPSLSHHMLSPRLAHRSVIVELRAALERMQGQFKALLPSARARKVLK